MSIAADNVLGALLIDVSAYWRIAEIVKVEDFQPEDRALFARIAKAANDGETYDAITAMDEGFAQAVDLAALTASTVNIEGWAQRVAGTSETGKVREAGRRIAICDDYNQAQEILAAVRPEQMAQVKSVQDGLRDFVEVYRARLEAGGSVTGVPTGITGLDDLTSGWQPGNLITIVGETSMGKSTLALQSAIAAAKYAKKIGKHVLYFSLEMTVAELTERAIAHLGDFPLAWITHPKDAPDYAIDYIKAGSAAFDELPLMFDDRAGLTSEQITSRTIQVHMTKPLVAAFVDYMHIMGRPRRNDVAELGGIAASLKNLSKLLGISVVALHQLNRSNHNKRPTLGDIRASGEIAEASNVVCAIYRSEVAQPLFERLLGYAEVLILKNRQGRRDVRAWAKSKIGNMRFESCEAPDGYDERIREDESSGGTGSGGAGRGIPSRSGPRGQSRPLSVVSGND